MKSLNGKELAGYIKQRQATQVRSLTQSRGVVPKLVILYDLTNNAAIATYMRLKKQYGEDIGVEVEAVHSKDLAVDINAYNLDKSVHGIIVQLPVKDQQNVADTLSLVADKKDVDGLGRGDVFKPATPTAILWLLAGYNVDLVGKNIHVIGRGRLVGGPLVDMFAASGLETTIHTSKTGPIDVSNADIIVTATGSPGVLNSKMIPEGAVVVDAGTASDKAETKGDLADDVYDRDDLIITPRRGGVGPLTVSALFDNVILAAGETVA